MKSIIVVGLLFVGTSLAGCASQSELDAVRNLAVTAQTTADQAIECCVTTNQKIDRMYQKIIGK